MNADCMLDANILVYAVDRNPENRQKQEVAMGLIRDCNFGLSTQVMQEFYVTVTRKLKIRLSPDRALAYLDRFQAFPVIPTDYGLVIDGIRTSLRYQVSYWDATILAAAGRLGAKIVYSEDLNSGQQYGSVKVVNPF